MSLRERFSTRYIVEPNSGCWLWIAGVNSTGYGQIRANGRQEGAHRVAWMLLRGPIPDGAHVLHHCDTTSCVNPVHLFLGTNADNIRDAVAKGRLVAVPPYQKGEDHGMATLTTDQAEAIRSATGPQREIAARYGVSQQHVSNIKRGKRWAHLQEGEVASCPF